MVNKIIEVSTGEIMYTLWDEHENKSSVCLCKLDDPSDIDVCAIDGYCSSLFLISEGRVGLMVYADVDRRDGAIFPNNPQIMVIDWMLEVQGASQATGWESMLSRPSRPEEYVGVFNGMYLSIAQDDERMGHPQRFMAMASSLLNHLYPIAQVQSPLLTCVSHDAIDHVFFNAICQSWSGWAVCAVGENTIRQLLETPCLSSSVSPTKRIWCVTEVGRQLLCHDHQGILRVVSNNVRGKAMAASIEDTVIVMDSYSPTPRIVGLDGSQKSMQHTISSVCALNEGGYAAISGNRVIRLDAWGEVVK